MATELVDKLNVQHPHYKDMYQAWSVYEMLYEGGKKIQDHATQFLMKRPKELNEVYLQRVQRFTYDNIIGSGIGYYESELFRRDPDIDFHLKNKASTVAVPDAKLQFYRDEFLTNADRGGTTFIDLWRQIFLAMMQFRCCYVCIDLPSKNDDVRTLFDAKQAGALNPYVMVYDPRSVINWETDAYGNLIWIVIQQFSTRKEFLGPSLTVQRWYYYDRKEYRIYQQTKEKRAADDTPIKLFGPDGSAIISDGSKTADLIDQGPHALAKYNRVPVQRFGIPFSVWLMNRAFLPGLKHINLTNSYFWALEMANLPIPVIKTDGDFTQTLSESAFIQLDKEASFEWTEPKGTSFEHSAKCIASQREEIHRQMYLMAQGRSSSASASASSGYSKEVDMMPSKSVLGKYGDIVRAGMQECLGLVALAHGDEDLDFDVHGFSFSQGDAVQQIEMMEFLEDADIQSDTLYMEEEKRVALAILQDANRSVIDTVINEIETGPKRSERQAAEQQQQKAAFTNQLQRATDSIGKRIGAAA